MQATVPGFWVSMPSAPRDRRPPRRRWLSRDVDAVASGLTATPCTAEAGSVCQGPAPVSEMQAAVPAFCVSAPSTARSNTATAPLSTAAT